MTTKRAFLPPLINPLVVGAFWVAFPFLLRWGELKVTIDPDSLARLKQYRGQRMLMLPNHPTGEEPVVLFELFRWLREVVHYVAAREVFDWEHGFRGWVLRRVGAYSVIRGAADRESFLMSKKILMEGLHRLIIFIEGEISRGTETLIPFEPGVLQLAFWAQEGLFKEAQKKEKAHPGTSTEEAPPIYIAPIAIKYFYEPGSEARQKEALDELEQTVGLTSEPNASTYQRIRDIGMKILEVQEAMHNLVPLPEVTLTQRVEAIKHRMLRKMELFLDLKPDPQATTLNRLREIRNTMDHLIHTYDNPDTLTGYERSMVEHLRVALSEFYNDLNRVVYFLTYNENALKETQSPEQFIDAIRRLEREVYGKAKLTHRRVAHVRVGEVINLKDKFQDYEQDKKGYTKIMAADLEENMRQMLKSMTGR
jgi:1-acyl-sn-glycerol-3-phosphate acyltransferase